MPLIVDSDKGRLSKSFPTKFPDQMEQTVYFSFFHCSSWSLIKFEVISLQVYFLELKKNLFLLSYATFST